MLDDYARFTDGHGDPAGIAFSPGGSQCPRRLAQEAGAAARVTGQPSIHGLAPGYLTRTLAGIDAAPASPSPSPGAGCLLLITPGRP